MKHIYLPLLLTLVLFQGCYSYQKIDLDTNEPITEGKVKIELKNSKKLKGIVVESKNDSISIQKKDQTFKISKTEIEKLKKREFSWTKTTIVSVVYTSIVTIGITLYLIIAPFS